MKNKLPFILFIMAVICKFTWFYDTTFVKNYFTAVVLISVVLYAGIVFLLSKKHWLALTATGILTALMEGEVLYFRYFNKLLSFQNMSQAKFVDSVSEAVLTLFRVSDLVLVVDILILLVILYKKKDLLIQPLKFKAITAILLAIILPMTFLIAAENSFAISVANQEFFIYHVKDGLEVYKEEESSETVEKPIFELVEKPEKSIRAKYQGLFKGKNLISIQVESLQDMMVLGRYNDQDIMPFLKTLIEKDSFYFSSYYQQLGKGNTSDAEFSSHNSLYPSMAGISYDRYKNHDFRGLPILLKEEGYNTMVFHGNEASFWHRQDAYPKQGFSTYYSEERLVIDEVLGMGLSDKSLFRQGLEILKNEEDPFYGFFITLTNHYPYKMPEDHVSIDVDEKDKDHLFGKYIEAVRYTDDALKEFYQGLDQAGLLESSVLVIYGDHHGIPCMDEQHKKDVGDFLGYDYDFDQMMNVPLIIHAPGTGISLVDDGVFDQQDLFPTLVNLFDLDKDLNMMGQDMLNSDDHFALFQTYMVAGSFMQDDIVFEMSRDGIFEHSRAYNRKTRQAVSLSDCVKGYQRALNELQMSKYILENNKVIKD